MVINKKRIDPLSLDALAKEGFMALRAKEGFMERVVLACGGTAMNSLEKLDESALGQVGIV